MKNILNTGKGYRSYIAVAVLFVIGGLKAIGVIDEATASTINNFAIGLGIFGLRQAK
jgi:hypothetical protein